MKSKATIRKQIARLRRIAKGDVWQSERDAASAAWHALRWVIEDDICWSPAGLAERRISERADDALRGEA